MKLLLTLFALLFPWVILLIYANPIEALIALILQATIIGWPFASAWALRIIRKSKKSGQYKP